jgi:hypothetical protein
MELRRNATRKTTLEFLHKLGDWIGDRWISPVKRPAGTKPYQRLLAETEGFEPSIGLYNPITV